MECGEGWATYGFPPTTPGPGDIDGDGVPDVDDVDVDNDGVPNRFDIDMDGDGTPDASDDDIDGDGIPNAADPDADGDGLFNEEETAQGSDPFDFNSPGQPPCLVSIPAVIAANDDAAYTIDPARSESWVAWSAVSPSEGPGDCPGDFEIFVFDGSTTQQLTHNCGDDLRPRVGGETVAWIGCDDDTDAVDPVALAESGTTVSGRCLRRGRWTTSLQWFAGLRPGIVWQLGTLVQRGQRRLGDLPLERRAHRGGRRARHERQQQRPRRRATGDLRLRAQPGLAFLRRGLGR